ncbi:ABC transporter substrate-binding protein [Neobacillus soli]|uniref:ABC transporter substrate-binding protein n=1 Tax=Neobacillus soli TaxID=220688 RepID=UPI0008265460|nr:ABC transporter substrate-binding protein [Neobacillus soli]
MRKKKLAGLFMSLMVAAGVLAGCNSSTSGDEKKDEVIKIGANLELSGGVASYGQSIKEGIDLALEEINKEGINGKKVQLVQVDNKSEAPEAINGATKLISQDKVVAIIGAATSGNTKAQIEIAQSNNVPLLTPTGTAADVTVKDGKVLNDFVFRTCFIDPFQGTVAANFAANELKVKTAAIFIDSASDYSKGLAASFKELFEKEGGKIVKEEAYVAKDTDFHAQLTNIKGEKPDFIFVPGYYEEVGLIVKQARELGIDVPMMGADGWDSPKLVELAGKDALNNTFITNHYSSGDSDPKVQDFVKAFKAKYKDKSPDAFNALGYDSAYFLADAIKRAGSSDSKKIQKALAETDGLELVTGKMKLDKDHNPIKSAVILEYKNGEQTFKTKVNPE